MKVKVIAIPFAGGNVYSYKSFEQIMPTDFKLMTFEFPGRGERVYETFIEDAERLAQDLFRQIKNEITDVPYIIYGHSLGSLIGYEVVKEIVNNGYPLPKHLFFTGRSGPSIPEESRISEYPSGAFWDEINKMGGLPPTVLANKELREFFEPILRSDFKVAESYSYCPLRLPFPIPITVVAGTDESDITDEKLGTWQKETSFSLKKSFMKGNHFFIFDNTNEIVRQMTSASLIRGEI